MDDLIKSLENKLLIFDKESKERGLTLKEEKQREHIKYDIYWNKLKKFKEDFERLIFSDVAKLMDSMATPLLEKNIVHKIETHVRHKTRHYAPDLPIYMIVSISDKAISLANRWEQSTFLLIKGNHEKETIDLFSCNVDLAYVSEFIKENDFGKPIAQLKIGKYKFNSLKPLIKNWINGSLDIILESESYKKNNKIV